MLDTVRLMKMGGLVWVGLTVLIVWPPSVFAQSPVFFSSLADCKAIKKDKKRLKCLDEILEGFDEQKLGQISEQPHEGSSPVPVATSSGVISPAPTEAELSKGVVVDHEKDFARESLPTERKKRRDDKPKALNASVIEIARNKLGRYVIILDNGQVWRQIKADTSRLLVPKDLESNPVVIKRQSFGSFRLSFKKDNRSIKVERIK